MTSRARDAILEDAVLGVRPRMVYEPATVQEAIEVIRQAADGRQALTFVGGATDLEQGAPPTKLDAVVRTVGLSRVIEHAPSDQIVVVEAGVTLAALQRALASSRQRLALDPPLPERATIGGIIAGNAFGPRRARFGSVRDLIIGVSLVRADGTLARGGSKVVKNVAGFDLPRLMVGSLGTLGLIATATLRLHPLAQVERTLLFSDRTAGGVRALVAGIRRLQLEPTSVVAVWRAGNRFEVGVRFEGFEAGVHEQLRRARELLETDDGAACTALDPDAARAFWDRQDDLRVGAPLRARIALLPTQIEDLAESVLPELLPALSRPGFLWYATLGLGFLSGAPVNPDAAAAALRSARALLEDRRGTLVVQSAPEAIRSRVNVWGSPPRALGLMKNVKARLDPDGRLAPGRFVGGI